MVKYVNLAGTVIRICADDGWMPEDFGAMKPFVTEPRAYDREISFDAVETLSKPCGVCIFTGNGRKVYRTEDGYISYAGSVETTLDGAYLRMNRQGKRSSVEVKRSVLRGRLTSTVILDAMEAEHLTVSNDGFILHSSYISHEDGAILFTAPSGTGKSTQAALWEKHRGAEIINGDRSVIRIREAAVEAWGVPFSGSSGICKARTLPLKAIVCLAQAPETTIRRISGVQAFRLLWEGCSFQPWSREDVERCSETLLKVIAQIPVFYLACTPDESAVIALEQALRK